MTREIERLPGAPTLSLARRRPALDLSFPTVTWPGRSGAISSFLENAPTPEVDGFVTEELAPSV